MIKGCIKLNFLINVIALDFYFGKLLVPVLRVTARYLSKSSAGASAARLRAAPSILTPEIAVVTRICSPALVWKSKRAIAELPIRLPSLMTAAVSNCTDANGLEKRVRK